MTRLWSNGDPVQVVVGEEGSLRQLYWHGAWHEVSAIANRWRVRSTWWLPAADAWREYIKLTTADGLLCTVYRDLQEDAWYFARMYD